MPRTPEERAAINRANAQKSTGPKSAEGKARSRLNALKHGLRAETAALPGEDPAAVTERSAAWNDYYQPASPAAQHLVNECVRATLLSDRVDRYHHAALDGQARSAYEQWERARRDALEAGLAKFDADPAGAVSALRGSVPGCDHLTTRWERLKGRLAGGDWSNDVLAESLRLQGIDEDLEGPASDASRDTRFLFILCRHAAESGDRDLPRLIAALPDASQNLYQSLGSPPAPECRARIHATIDARLNDLRRARARCGAVEEGDLADAVNRALVLQDPQAARLFLRYHAEARASFHRSYNALLKALDRDATAPPIEATPDEIAAPDQTNRSGAVGAKGSSPIEAISTTPTAHNQTNQSGAAGAKDGPPIEATATPPIGPRPNEPETDAAANGSPTEPIAAGGVPFDPDAGPGFTTAPVFGSLAVPSGP